MSNRPIVTDSATPRKVDENITANGGGEGNNPGSYRLLYSQKPFDQMTETQAVPFIEFSADVTMKGAPSMHILHNLELKGTSFDLQSGSIINGAY